MRCHAGSWHSRDPPDRFLLTIRKLTARGYTTFDKRQTSRRGASRLAPSTQADRPGTELLALPGLPIPPHVVVGVRHAMHNCRDVGEKVIYLDFAGRASPDHTTLLKLLARGEQKAAKPLGH